MSSRSRVLAFPCPCVLACLSLVWLKVSTGAIRPTTAHHFIRLLHDKGLLLRNYTQNIDALEAVAGVPLDRVVQAHGTMSTATCNRCGHHAIPAKLWARVMATRPGGGGGGEEGEEGEEGDESGGGDGGEGGDEGGDDVCLRAAIGCTECVEGSYVPDVVMFGEALPKRVAELSLNDMRGAGDRARQRQSQRDRHDSFTLHTNLTMVNLE